MHATAETKKTLEFDSGFARESYFCPMWNGRFLHVGNNYLYHATSLAIKAFMIAVGYQLIASLPIAGVLIAITGGCFLIKNVIDVIKRPNTLVDGLNVALGSYGPIEKLTEYTPQEGKTLFDIYGSATSPDVKSPLKVVKDGKITHVIVNYAVHHQPNGQKQKNSTTITVTRVFDLTSNFFEYKCEYNEAERTSTQKKSGREIYYLNFMTPWGGNFFEHLFKQTVLHKREDGAYSYNLI